MQYVEDHRRHAGIAEAFDWFAGFRIERKNERACGGIHNSVVDDDTAVPKNIAFAAATAEFAADIVFPKQMAVGGIGCVDAAARVGHVHNPVDNNGRRLITHAIDNPMLEKPRGL